MTVRHVPRAAFAAAYAAVLVLGAAGFLAPWAAGHPLPDWSGRLWMIRVTHASVGMAFALAGLAAWRRRPSVGVGPLMVAIGVAWFITDFSWVRSAWPLVFANFGERLYEPILGHLLVTFPSGKTRARSERTLIAAMYGYWLVGSLAYSLVNDPRSGCPDCPSSPVRVTSSKTWAETVGQVNAAVAVALALCVAILVVAHWRRGSPPYRRALAPVAWALGPIVLIVSADQLGAAFFSSGSTYFYVDSVGTLALAALPLGLLVGVLRAQLGMSEVARRIVELGQSPSPSATRDVLAAALGDPSLRIAYWLPEESIYVDQDRLPVDPFAQAEQVATLVGDGDDRVAALLHDPSLEHEPERLEAVAAAARLTLDNQRLNAYVALRRELPQTLVEQLHVSGHRIGETRTLEITVLLSDVRGYTTIAENADAVRLAGQVHEHRIAMGEEIHEHGGTVMQYVGDAVFAVFGAPLASEGHPDSAVAAAVGMQRRQAVVNRRWESEGLPPFDLGIGVSTGRVAAAILGSRHHLEYTVVGDTVNLAQRLQQLAERGEIVVSAPTHEALTSPIGAEAIPALQVKGRVSAVSAFRIHVGSH